MKRRQLLVGTATAAASATLGGCLSTAEENDGQSGDSVRTVTVSGSGETEAEPDLAAFQATVEATGDTASEVRDELATRSERLRDELLAFGIDEDDVTTGRFDVRERIDERRMEEAGVDPRSEDDEELSEFRYYEGRHSLTVETDDVDAVGDAIDTAIDAGADSIGRVRFTLSEERREDLQEDAIREAIESARTEAEFVAAELDATVVEATRVQTGGGVSPVRERVAADDVAEEAAAPSTELHPDDVTVDASVDIEYRIE